MVFADNCITFPVSDTFFFIDDFWSLLNRLSVLDFAPLVIGTVAFFVLGVCPQVFM